MELAKFTVYVSYFKMQEHVYLGTEAATGGVLGGLSCFCISSLVTHIKENMTAKLQKLYRPPRNLRVGNKSPAPFLKRNLFARVRTKYSLKGLIKYQLFWLKCSGSFDITNM